MRGAILLWTSRNNFCMITDHKTKTAMLSYPHQSVHNKSTWSKIAQQRIQAKCSINN